MLYTHTHTHTYIYIYIYLILHQIRLIPSSTTLTTIQGVFVFCLTNQRPPGAAIALRYTQSLGRLQHPVKEAVRMLAVMIALRKTGKIRQCQSRC